jgi:hypothetical protein
MGSAFSRRRGALLSFGGSGSRRRRQRAAEDVASLGRARTLQEALLDSYVESLSPADLELQFDVSSSSSSSSSSPSPPLNNTTGNHQKKPLVLQRFYLCCVLVDRDSLEHVMSFLDAPSLLRAIETSKTFFQIADTPWIWDALDGLEGNLYSMGRYDYQVRHRRMRLTVGERRAHLAHCQRAELEEHREKTYRGDSRLDRFKCATKSKIKNVEA